MSLNLSNETRNYYVGDASRTLTSAGRPEIAQQLQSGASVLPGVATTAAMMVNGNPKSVLGRIAPELESSALSTTMRFASMASMFSMIQNIMPMLSGVAGGMAGGLFANLGNSGGLAAMGNMPGNPLAKSFTDLMGITPASVKMVSVEPSTGATSTFGAPPINTPSATPVQQNVMAAVPGMSAPAPSM